MTWVKFHEEITRGDKRGVSRASRFVFLELALLSRPTHGRLRLARTMPTADAVHDAIGGNRAEVEAALAELADPMIAMLVVEETESTRELVIPSWTKWNSVDVGAAARNRKHRAKQKRDRDAAAQREHDGSVTRNETARYGSGTEVGTDRVTRTEERREDQKAPSEPTRASVRAARVELGSASCERMAEVFGDTVREIVPTYTLASADRAKLVELANCNAAPVELDAKIAWLEKTVRAYLAAKRGDAFECAQGFRPHRVLVWLNGGGTTSTAAPGKQPASAELLAELERGGS